jgi:hypothetical protein
MSYEAPASFPPHADLVSDHLAVLLCGTPIQALSFSPFCESLALACYRTGCSGASIPMRNWRHWAAGRIAPGNTTNLWRTFSVPIARCQRITLCCGWCWGHILWSLRIGLLIRSTVIDWFKRQWHACGRSTSIDIIDDGVFVGRVGTCLTKPISEQYRSSLHRQLIAGAVDLLEFRLLFGLLRSHRSRA